jgi:NADPH:quinone reductase-like Zn-dependent oxidoreductase
MKAAVHARYGPPEVVRVVDVDKPVIGGHEVLVRVHATTVNRTDCGFRAAKPFLTRLFTGLVRPRATILGNEFAGVIEEVGDRVTAFALGDRVFGFSAARFGAHAEYLAMPDDGPIATMPGNATFEQAAAANEASHYALTCITGAKIHNGQAVLVYGATGGIGSAAVQLLKSMQVYVTAVCATQHVDLVAGLGADKVVDYLTSDFTRDEQVYDVVFDAVGKTTLWRCRRLLKPRGIFVSTDVGPMWQNLALIPLTALLPGRRVMIPVKPHSQDKVRRFQRLVEAGQFTPVIDRVYPLDQIVDAYRYVDTGQKVGNVVISIRG